jgi:hypothetical protein
LIKRLALIFGGMALIASLRPAYTIGMNLGFWQPLTRPVSISAGAHYVETFEGPKWFDCSTEQTKDVNTCRAWDGDGHLIAFGHYRLD